MEKHFSKKLVMTKKVREDFEKCTRCWICDNVYMDSNVKVRVYCRITGKFRGSVQRDCHKSVKLNHEIPIVFHNVRNYDSHLIM